ncbi:GntP family permease [Sporomusa malonica]|uniref:H+/gluconate symporter n=1 Tax=Sporomusa malonica TaxID=112901 RepID=A0A1W1ZL77_9FIRM|nr:GntP family permease [Sporomusa malonica]SMC48801.1 H+/gluconate symporter [Sporomusa malonica]
MELFAILLSLILLMFFAFRGYSIILFAPLFAILAAAASNFSLMPVYTEIFMTKAAEYFKMYFSIFLLGAVFAKVMEDGGMARAIAGAIASTLGKEHAILAVILGCASLTYGGISVFVVVFVMYPFAAALYREANIPKRFIPAALWLGTFTFSMGAFPGSPQIQNIIPTAFFGTSTWAAPLLGMSSGFAVFLLGWAWLVYRQRQAKELDEGYGAHTVNEPEDKTERQLPGQMLAFLPLIVVLLTNLYLSNPFKWSWAYQWNEEILLPFKVLKLSLLSTSVDKVRAIWSLNIALILGILLAIFIGREQLCRTAGIASSLNSGANSSLVAVLNTASGYGYGSVVASLAGFQVIKSFLMDIKIGAGPLVSEAITVNIMAAITGSASGGMTIALGMLAADYLTWAQAANISPDVLHRFAALASGGLDSMPHNGGLITVMAVCGLTHKQSYYDLFVITVIKTLLVFIFIALYI